MKTYKYQSLGLTRGFTVHGYDAVALYDKDAGQDGAALDAANRHLMNGMGATIRRVYAAAVETATGILRTRATRPSKLDETKTVTEITESDVDFIKRVRAELLAKEGATSDTVEVELQRIADTMPVPYGRNANGTPKINVGFFILSAAETTEELTKADAPFIEAAERIIANKNEAKFVAIFKKINIEHGPFTGVAHDAAVTNLALAIKKKHVAELAAKKKELDALS